jgi:hypothetical protein
MKKKPKDVFELNVIDLADLIHESRDKIRISRTSNGKANDEIEIEKKVIYAEVVNFCGRVEAIGFCQLYNEEVAQQRNRTL